MKNTIFLFIHRIIIVGLIAACLGFSICVFNSMKNCEITVNETTTHIVKCNKNDAPHHGKVVQEKTNMYPIFCMTYFVVLAGTVVALIVLFAKDDSWLKCAKLDELREIREKFFAGEVNDSANKTETTDNRAELLKHYMNCVADI